MKALVHYPENGVEPVGVWWMEGTRSRPKNFYLKSSERTRGAVEILGTEYNGEPFTLANWKYVLERLPESSSPFSTWVAADYTGDPRDLLT